MSEHRHLIIKSLPKKITHLSLPQYHIQERSSYWYSNITMGSKHQSDWNSSELNDSRLTMLTWTLSFWQFLNDPDVKLIHLLECSALCIHLLAAQCSQSPFRTVSLRTVKSQREWGTDRFCVSKKINKLWKHCPKYQKKVQVHWKFF